MKKTLLTLGSLAAAVAPVATAVACGSSSKNTNGTITFPTVVARAANTAASFTTGSTRKVLVAVDGHDHSVTDKSFNEQAESAATAIASSVTHGTNVTKADPGVPATDDLTGFREMYTNAPADSIIIAPGFAHINPITNSKAALQGKYVILVDGDVVQYSDKTPASNVAAIQYKTEQAAFLAGYMTGEYLNSKKTEFQEGGLKVGGFGGMNFPTVTGFLAGFQQGINFFNANKTNTQLPVSFIDLGDKADYFSQSFAPGKGTALSQKLLASGADMILPVAGPQTQDVINAIKAAKSHTQVIGVDTAQEDQYTDVAFGRKILAYSILKKIKESVVSVFNKMMGDNIAGVNGLGALTIGDLANNLVGVSQTGDGEVLHSIYTAASSNTTLMNAAKAAKISFNY